MGGTLQPGIQALSQTLAEHDGKVLGQGHSALAIGRQVRQVMKASAIGRIHLVGRG
jgi:hypothetical protein